MEPYVRTQVSASQLSRIQSQIKELDSLVKKAVNDAEYGSSEISDRLDLISGYLSDASDAANDVTIDVDPDAIPQPSISIDGDFDPDDFDPENPTLPDINVSFDQDFDVSDVVTVSNINMVVGSVTAANSQLSLITENVKNTSTALSADIRNISSKFNELTNTMFSAISSLTGGTGDLIVDASSIDINSVTLGKVSLSRNSGAVYGDVNTGGIAGSMAIEYTLDPEDDVTGHLSNIYRKQYEYKSIIQKCVNTGDVSGKRSYVGGIVGRMDLGYLTACETSSCTITNENGSYTGGIVGSGVQENVDGSGSSVRWNYSLVDITDCQQYQGAISGSDTGTFEHNYYVSDDLPGINRQGYAGRAEPISYSQLLALSDLPESMKSFTLTFVADDKTVLSRTFNYGDSIDESDIPEPPTKSGCHVHWDRTDLTNLHFDTVVTAVYEAYTPGLASEQTRESGQAVILVEGNYNDGDTITVTAQPLTPAAFDVQSGTVLDRVKGYFSCLSRGEMPSMVANAEVLEQWRIELADDCLLYTSDAADE